MEHGAGHGGVAILFTLFIAVVALVGTRVLSRRSEWLEAPISPLSPLTVSLALCLGLAALASQLGLAAIIGAFLAGMVLAESRQRHSLERQIQPIMAFLVPFFFVATGAQVDLHALSSLEAIGSLLVVTLLAVIGKLVGCGLGALSLGRRGALVVGFGMVPRGEVGIIVASLGQAAGVFSGRTYAIIIAMSLLTSVVAPPVLKALLSDRGRRPVTVPPDEPEPPASEGASTGEAEGEDSPLYRVDECGYDAPPPGPDAPPARGAGGGAAGGQPE